MRFGSIFQIGKKPVQPSKAFQSLVSQAPETFQSLPAALPNQKPSVTNGNLQKPSEAEIEFFDRNWFLAEQARERFGWKVEPVTFTPAVKEELAFTLRRDFEDHRLRIVRDDNLRSDLRALKKDVTAAGNIRFAGESEDSHCDRTWAKALRQHAARYRPCAGGAVA